MNIEKQIGFKAIAIYIFIIVITIIVLLYGSKLKQEIHIQRNNIITQQDALELTNSLVAETGQLLLETSAYLSTQDPALIRQFENEIVRIDSLITLLMQKDATNEAELQQLSLLLHKQAGNMRKLQENLSKENPLIYFQTMQKQQRQLEATPMQPSIVLQDTLVEIAEQKKFFRRLRDAFSGKVDTTLIVYTPTIDTLQILRADSLALLTEIDAIVQKAGKQYEHNISDIRLQINQFIQADRSISTEINNLLIQFYNRILASIHQTIIQSETVINKNYKLLVIGGISVLILILTLLLLIILDVNKGKQAREKLRQVMNTRHQLLLAVAHDIKTPLNTIQGYLELEQDKQTGQGQSSPNKSMQNAAGYIHTMLENLLHFSSIEQGSLNLSVSIINTKLLADELQAWFLPLANQKKLDLKFEYPNINIQTDVLKLKQICTNIISNAIKYTQTGSIKVNIQVDNSNFKLQVTDTGVGIPEDKKAMIYRPFVRFEENNKHSEGSGVGMYVVKGLTELLQGNIYIESQVNKGTSVNIEIPVKIVNTQIPKGNKRVIIFEDDESMKKLVEDMVLKLGHQIVQHDYNLIITDMEMNNISGTDILQSNSKVPVILMSGRTDFTNAQALSLGFAGFLPKPFNLNDLKHMIGEGDLQKTVDSFSIEDDEEIMQIFRQSTLENQQKLKQYLALRNFKQAQVICHRMLPMFAQLGYPTEALKRMDESRGTLYLGWMDDVQSIIDIKV